MDIERVVYIRLASQSNACGIFQRRETTGLASWLAGASFNIFFCCVLLCRLCCLWLSVLFLDSSAFMLRIPLVQWNDASVWLGGPGFLIVFGFSLDSSSVSLICLPFFFPRIKAPFGPPAKYNVLYNGYQLVAAEFYSLFCLPVAVVEPAINHYRSVRR